jgi:hypothetical protein
VAEGIRGLVTWPYFPQEDVAGCHERLGERIALLCGCSKKKAAKLGHKQLEHFMGRAMNAALADEIVDWIIQKSDCRCGR